MVFTYAKAFVYLILLIRYSSVLYICVLFPLAFGKSQISLVTAMFSVSKICFKIIILCEE